MLRPFLRPLVSHPADVVPLRQRCHRVRQADKPDRLPVDTPIGQLYLYPPDDIRLDRQEQVPQRTRRMLPTRLTVLRINIFESWSIERIYPQE